MADRTSSAGPGGDIGNTLALMASRIRDLENRVTQLQRNAYSPGADMLWVVGSDGIIRVKRISTGNTAEVAGPL